MNATAMFHTLYAAGIVTFVVAPTYSSIWMCKSYAAAGFGLVAYGAYDLSNIETLKLWHGLWSHRNQAPVQRAALKLAMNCSTSTPWSLIAEARSPSFAKQHSVVALAKSSSPSVSFQ